MLYTKILAIKNAYTELDLRQKKVMKNLEQLQLLNWNWINPFVMTSLSLTIVSRNYYNPKDYLVNYKEIWVKKYINHGLTGMP